MSSSSSTEALPFAQERASAVDVVVRACHLVRQVQASLVSEETLQKKDKSPVTVADFASQAIIVHELTRRFPAYPFIAEESSGQLRKPGQEEVRSRLFEVVRTALPAEVVPDENALLDLIDRGSAKLNESVGADAEPKSPSGLWWTLDPIDGTLGFLRKEQYAVALALMQDNEPVLGILGCPALPHNINDPSSPVGCLLVAVRGQGCFMRSLDEGATESRVSVSDITDSTKANFTESVEAAHSYHDVNQRIVDKLGVTIKSIRMDSQCKYAILARGDASIYLRMTRGSYVENIWDHAAGAIIIKEAGGEVTDFEGKPLDWSHGKKLTHNKYVVATNGKLHSTVLAAIRSVLQETPLE